MRYFMLLGLMLGLTLSQGVMAAGEEANGASMGEGKGSKSGSCRMKSGNPTARKGSETGTVATDPTTTSAGAAEGTPGVKK